MERNTRLDMLRNVLTLIKSKVFGPSTYALCSIAGFLFLYNTINVGIREIFTTALIVAGSCFLLGNAMYNLNDLFDRDYDKVNERDKPLSKGGVDAGDVTVTVVILSTAAFSLLGLINVQTLILGTLCLGAGIVYSTPPIRLKKRLWGKSLSISSIIALSTISGGLALDTNLSVLILMGLSIGIFVSLIFHVHDIRDLEGDKEGGCRTLPMVIGKKNTILLAGLAYLSILVFSVLGVLFLGFNYLFPLGILITSFFGIKALAGIWPPDGTPTRQKKVRTTNRISIATFALMFFFGSL